MALKFLNKKGWHTGSLRNIENVWKAEQKHEAEKNKLEELRKQIHEERERAEFRQLQEQAGLISSQERLEFLYDSGLAVGKGSSGFKALESVPKTDPETTASSSTPAKQESLGPGALFEEKPQSANDAWRKLHSDPLLMIRQREQEALARIKNNPVKMAMIRKSVETKNKDKDEKKHRKKHHKKKSRCRSYSSSENDSDREDAVEKQREGRHKGSKPNEPSSKTAHTSDEEPSEGDNGRNKYHDKEYKDRRPSGTSNSKHHKSEDREDAVEKQRDSRNKGSKLNEPFSKTVHTSDEEQSEVNNGRNKYHDKEYKDRRPRGASNSKHHKSDDHEGAVEKQRESRHKGSKPKEPSSKTAHTSDEEPSEGDNGKNKYHDKEYKDRRPSGASNSKHHKSDDQQRSRKTYYDSRYSSERQVESHHEKRSYSNTSDKPPRPESNNQRRNPVKLSEEERAARLREMQMDAEIHEEQRWKRIKKAADDDAQEAIGDRASVGRNFLDAAQRSIYGAEKGGSSTIEESVRRRMHYSQRGGASDGNAFRRT